MSYIALAAYDGVPGDVDRPRTNPIVLEDKDGMLLIGEMGLASADEINKIALGFWDYTARLDDQLDVDENGDPKKSSAHGAYLLSSYRWYHDEKANRALGTYVRVGVADGNTAQTGWDYSAGLVGNGWMPGRPESEIGLGISQARNSRSYMRAQEAADTPTDRNEYGYEVYYRDHLYRGVSIQPDFQYIVNPGTDPTLKNATILGLRADVSF